jgi:transcriptional regulator with XRE-family HTH domain
MKDVSTAIEEERLKVIRQITSAMAGSKLSLRKWAEVIGIRPSALSEILRGERDPLFSTYLKISVAVQRKREEE